ncbi:C2 domain-containing protein [Aphelenchoides fujianensis]|nr:C2 domain-containing protein [Aphelenchoides fujianensis]
MSMRRVFHSCYGLCPPLRFLIPRTGSTLEDGDEKAVESPTASVCLEMSEMGSIKHDVQEMDFFEPTEGNAVEPFDPAIDHLRVLSQYSPQKRLLIVSIVEAAGQGDVCRPPSSQVRVALLSDKVIKKQTPFVHGPAPKFNHTFAFKMEEARLEDTVIRFRFYKKRVTRSHLVGEAYLKGRKIGPHALHLLKLREPLHLEKKVGRSIDYVHPSSHLSATPQLIAVIENNDTVITVSSSLLRVSRCVSSSNYPTAPLRSPPARRSSGSRRKQNPSILQKMAKINTVQVLVSLAFSDVHETFRIGLEKTSKLDQLLEPEGKPMDCYFQVIIRSSTSELCRHRTKTFNCTSELTLDEVVLVHATLRDLHNLTVIVGFFSIHGFLKKRTLLGWLRFGADELESADCAEQWSEMIEDMGRSVERWHSLRRAVALNS